MGWFGRSPVFVALMLVALLTSVAASGSRSKTVTASAISIPNFTAAQDTAASGNDWISINGNLWSWRYDSLSQINTTNGNSLTPAWTTTYTPPSPNPDANGIQERPTVPAGNPLAYDGIVFSQDAWAHIYAIDGATGHILWSFDPKWTENPTQVNPVGTKSVISIGNGMVFTGAGGTVYALDAKTGAQLWATQIIDPATGALMSVPPIYYNGLLIDCVDGGDQGAAAFLVAIHASTGKVAWYYNTIPGKPGAQGWDTWPAQRGYFGGGGCWDPPTVNPNTNMVYFGVGNAIPFVGTLSGAGKQLDTESVLGLHVMTGKFAWVYQEVHHDIWDFDANGTPVLVPNANINGKSTVVLSHTNKDNYNYIINAATGVPAVPVTETPVPQDASQHTYPTQPIPNAERPGSPNELVPHIPTQPQAWQGLAPNGKPFVFSTVPFQPYNANTYVVGSSTGLSWNEASYSPQTNLTYICDNQGESATASVPATDLHMVSGNSAIFGRLTASSPLYTDAAGNVIAVNPDNQVVAWRYHTPGQTCSSQMVSTGGGITLLSEATGEIRALDSKTGSLDWSLQTGSTTIPRFGFYGIGGKEYMIVTGTSLNTDGSTSYWLKSYTT